MEPNLERKYLIARYSVHATTTKSAPNLMSCELMAMLYGVTSEPLNLRDYDQSQYNALPMQHLTFTAPSKQTYNVRTRTIQMTNFYSMNTTYQTYQYTLYTYMYMCQAVYTKS